MISLNSSFDFDSEFQARTRDQRERESRERFRMTQGQRGRSANQVRRSKRQPIISGICHRRRKKIY